MSILRGIISGKNWMIRPNSPTDNCIKSDVLIYPKDGKNFSKTLLYACSFCEGSLIPEANCTICKRTSIRRCVKCNHVFETINHESCRNLMSFGYEIIQKQSGLKK